MADTVTFHFRHKLPGVDYPLRHADAGLAFGVRETSGQHPHWMDVEGRCSPSLRVCAPAGLGTTIDWRLGYLGPSPQAVFRCRFAAAKISWRAALALTA
jgi:hypothetical protein